MSSSPRTSSSFGLSSSPVYWRWRDPLDDAGIGAVLDARTPTKVAQNNSGGAPRGGDGISPSSPTSLFETRASQGPGTFDRRAANLDRWIHGERDELLRCLQRSQAREHEAATVHGQLQERLRIALDRNAELEMKVRTQADALRRAEALLRSSARLAASGPFAGLPFPPPSPGRPQPAPPAVQSPYIQQPQQQPVAPQPVASQPIASQQPVFGAGQQPSPGGVEPEVEQIIKGIANIEATNLANLSSISQQLSNTQNINQELMVQVAHLHNRHERAEEEAKLAETRRQTQLEEQQRREREELGRQQASATSAIMAELRRLREVVNEKDEIEKVLVGGFSTLVAAATPAPAPRQERREDDGETEGAANYYTAPQPVSASVYETPAPPRFTRDGRREELQTRFLASGLKRWHNSAAKEGDGDTESTLTVPLGDFYSVRRSPTSPAASASAASSTPAEDTHALQTEMAWKKFADSINKSAGRRGREGKK